MEIGPNPKILEGFPRVHVLPQFQNKKEYLIPQSTKEGNPYEVGSVRLEKADYPSSRINTLWVQVGSESNLS